MISAFALNCFLSVSTHLKFDLSSHLSRVAGRCVSVRLHHQTDRQRILLSLASTASLLLLLRCSKGTTLHWGSTWNLRNSISTLAISVVRIISVIWHHHRTLRWQI